MTFHVWTSWSNLRWTCLWCPLCYSHLNPALQCQQKVGVGQAQIQVVQRGKNSGTGTMRCMTTNSIWNIGVYNVSFVISLRCCTPAKCAQRHLKRRKGRLQAWKCHLELPIKTRVESLVLFCFAKRSFYVACFGWFLKGDFLLYVEPVIMRNFSKFTLLLSNFFGSPFEVVAYKSSCQYLCRKNGKTYFVMMSGFDIWCGLTCKVVNIFLVVTTCPLVLSGSDGRHSTENFDI